jgi:hypothetical protein
MSEKRPITFTGPLGPVDGSLPGIKGPKVAAGQTPGEPINLQDVEVNGWKLQPYSAQNNALNSESEDARIAPDDMIRPGATRQG